MSYSYNEGEDFNAGQKEKKKHEEIEFRELLSTQKGRRFVYNIFVKGYIFTTTFTKSSEGYFNEGKRSIALEYFNAILDIDPSIFARMCNEFRNKEIE